MSTQNFKIKNGLSIGDHEIITSSGDITLPVGASINIGSSTLDKTSIDLGNVDNTSDINKPISIATQTALDNKVSTSTTVNGHALSGNITVTASDIGLSNVDNTSDVNKPISTATQTALDLKANQSTTYTKAYIDNLSDTYYTQTEMDATIGDINTSISNLETTISTGTAFKGAFDTASGLDTLTESSLIEGWMYGIRSTNDVYVYVASNTTFDYKPTGWTGGFVKFVNVADLTNLVTTEATTRAAAISNLDSTKVNKTITVNGHSLTDDVTVTKSDVGLGNVTNESKATMFTSPTFTGTVSGITKSMVGLGNVDNTTDLNKPISTATQTALDLKAPLESPTFTGTVSGTFSGNLSGTATAATTATTATTATNLNAGTTGQVILPSLSSGPSSPIAGQIYYNTAKKNMYMHDGSQWNQMAIGNTGFKYRQIITTSYVLGGYKDGSPWKNVNRMVHATDVCTNLGDQIPYAASYKQGAPSKTTAWVFGAANAHSTASANVVGMNMATETGRAVNSGNFMWASRSDAGVAFKEHEYVYVMSGGNMDKFNYTTETSSNPGMSILADGTGAGVQGICDDTHALIYGDNTGQIIAFYTDTLSSDYVLGGPAGGNNNQQKAINSKVGKGYAGNEGTYNGGYNFRVWDMTTNTMDRTVGKVEGNTGEENFDMGQDHQYMLGNYNGAQNNNGHKFMYASDSGFTLGSGSVRTGVPGGSSGITAWKG